MESEEQFGETSDLSEGTSHLASEMPPPPGPQSLSTDASENAEGPLTIADEAVAKFTCGFMTEKVFGKGQDSEPFWHVWKTDSITRTLIAVFDGMGGAGAMQVASLEDESVKVPMAYIASRVARDAFAYVCNQVTPSMSPMEIKEELEKRVHSQLQALLARPGGERSNGVRGSIVRDYPTTIAAALIEETDKGRRVYVLWAGDSRVYAMIDEPNKLLQQLSDDHNGSDRSADGGDAALTKFASPESAELEMMQYDLPKNSIVLAATDGCFGYASTQFLVTTLIESMDRARNQSEFIENLKRELSKIAGDDCSFTACFSPDFTFDDARTMFEPYLRELQDIRLVPKDNRFLIFSNEDFFRQLLDEKIGA